MILRCLFHETHTQARLERLGILDSMVGVLRHLQPDRSMVLMMDEYSTIQTDQITEIFKRGMNYAVFRKPDTGAEFAAITLVFVIKELEQDRALWPDVRMIYHYLSKKYHQIPLSGRR